jgi:alkylation response protein AidB-like acyl-CoA dehydrogenase
MDFKLTEEQKMVRTNVHDFLEKEIVPIADKRDREGPLTHEEIVAYRKKLEPIGFSMDFTSLGGMDPVSFGIIAEEVFGAWTSLGWAVGAGGSSLVALGPEKMRERLLPRAGELIGSLGITEPNAGSDNRAMQTRAVLDGNYYVINGTKTWITNATVADICLLIAKDEKGQLQQFLIDREESPFRSAELHKLGWRACPTGELYFDNCRVPKENNLTVMMTEMLSSGQTAKFLEERQIAPQALPFISSLFARGPLVGLLAFLRALFAICGVGISQRATDASIKYAQERVQFGRSIGRFQLIQNMIYEMFSLTEASRFLSYHALDAIFRGDPEARQASSLAKAFACEAAVKITSLGIEVHGAVGLSEDLPLERYFRDARTICIPDGTTEINKLVAGREILRMSAFI